jgi:peroxiredoxin
MPVFDRLQRRWANRVQFVGLSSDPPAQVERFAADIGIGYPLWIGDDRVADLSRRLGNVAGVLPYTVILDRNGHIAAAKAGPYSEWELDQILQKTAAIGA